MCGIAGFIDPFAASEPAQHALQRMLHRVSHRGPDDEGAWFDGPLAIGHRRLSILELSPLGHQPMVSASGRHVIAFNGEIYNHAELREGLRARGACFRGHSDTEVLLELVERHGLADALQQCTGMFAIALWDRAERRLQLARDRFGEKPLYYGWHDGRFLWASELRALAAHGSFRREIDQQAVAQLLTHGYIAAPRSIFECTRKLPAATILTLDVPDAAFNGRVRLAEDAAATRTYWSAADVLERGRQRPFRGSLAEAADGLEALLSDAVLRQMQADVPLGAFLSGGIDSSLVVALMQRQASRPVHTFSIGFEAARFDEAPYARAVASHLGTQHTEFRLSAEETMRSIGDATHALDEPMGDSSIIPTLLVARLARRHVKVALTGDGGDEIFAGYPKYALARRLENRRGSRVAARAAALADRDAVAGTAQRVLGWFGRREYGANLRRKAQLLRLSGDARIGRLRYQYAPPPALHPLMTGTLSSPSTGDTLDVVRRTMLDDQTLYLPEDILRKSDAATMAVALEGRAPLLDHRIAEFAARLPLAHLLDDAGRGKVVLREVLRRHVPAALFERPKAGFTIPLVDWFRRELRAPLVEHALDATAAEAFHLDRRTLHRLVDEHARGVNDWSQLLWTCWSLGDWLAAFPGDVHRRSGPQPHAAAHGSPASLLGTP